MIADKLLPLALAFIMLSLGLGLTVADFARVFRRPMAIGLGLFSQMLLLPLIAFGLAELFGLSPAMSVGLLLLAACPGGASSGLMTKLAGGETALSISLTAITSILAVFSVPVVVDLAMRHFVGNGIGLTLPVFDIVRGIFVITTVPVIAGMILRRTLPNFVARIEAPAGKLAVTLFIAIVIATFINQRQALIEHFPNVGPGALALCLGTMASGFGIGKLAGIEHRSCLAIAIESGLHNVALAIFLAVNVIKSPEMAVPGVIYAVLMNVCVIAVILFVRRTRPQLGAS